MSTVYSVFTGVHFTFKQRRLLSTVSGYTPCVHCLLHPTRVLFIIYPASVPTAPMFFSFKTLPAHCLSLTHTHVHVTSTHHSVLIVFLQMEDEDVMRKNKQPNGGVCEDSTPKHKKAERTFRSVLI